MISEPTTSESLSNIPVTPTSYAATSLLTYQEAFEEMYIEDIHTDPNNEVSILSADGVKFDIEIDLFSCYWDASVETCIVITERSQCHECGAYIDGAIFNRTGEGWKLRSFRSNITEIGNKGQVIKTEIIQIGPAKQAVQLKWIYSSTGTTVEHLVIFEGSGNSFDVILELGSRGETYNLEGGWNTNLYFQKTNEFGDYYHLIVTYYGNGKGKPYSEFYTFSDGKYNLVPKKSE